MTKHNKTESGSEATELCAKAFKLSIYAVWGAIAACMLAIAGLYPHAAGEVKDLLSATKTVVEAPALAHGGK